MKFLKCLICLFMVMSLFCGNIYATNNVDILNLEITEDEMEIQKGKLKKEVSDLVEKLRVSILEIDEKIEVLRQTDEYLTYPIIRLNLDTPILGMKSIINQKLKITNSVSATDVAKGYSIRDIVKNKTVKIPDTTIANITVNTKEVNIEEDMSITEYNTLILKLMNYVDKVENVSDFLDAKTNSMFKEYVSKDKKEKLNDFNNRLQKINNDLLASNEQLTKIYFTDKENYTNIESKYIELSKKQKELNEQVSDVLIESSKLNELQKEIISLESQVIDYLTEIDKFEIKDLAINNIYLEVYNELNNRLKLIEEYIEASTIEKEIIAEVSVENIEEQEQEDVLTDKKHQDEVEVEILYEVFSGKSVNNMKNIILSLEEKMDKLDIIYKVEEQVSEAEPEIENAEEEQKVVELAYENLTDEEIKTEFEYLIQKYNEFTKQEYTYYLDNVNELLKLINNKVNKLASVLDVSIISEVRYIYIDLPVSLENYLDTYSTNSTIETKYLISNFKNELDKLSLDYSNILKLYKELESEEKLNNA